MLKPKLVVMAAGLGSRYGGLKQMESVTREGEIILDFAVYDAMRAGFEDVVFIIKPEMEGTFIKRVMEPMSRHIRTKYVFQSIDQLPVGYSVPEGRTKPWGTCHAVMACEKLLDGPFAVINADDYYGSDAFEKIYQFLTQNKEDTTYCMAGYHVENTLSERGPVTRGICRVDDEFNLVEIHETKEIGCKDGHIVFPTEKGTREIAKGTVVSMNFWGFQPSVLTHLTERFPAFLDSANKFNPLNAEYLLPVEVGKMLEEGKAKVRVLEAEEKWYGVTYKEDKPVVTAAFEKMKEAGKYPKKLWL